MSFLTCFRHLLGASKSPAPTAVVTDSCDDVVPVMLTRLQQFCAAIPEGKAEVLMTGNQINVCFTWKPASTASATNGVVYWINGQNEDVTCAEVEMKEQQPSAIAKPAEALVDPAVVKATQVSPQVFDKQKEEKEKESLQLKHLRRLVAFLQLHYAFRYNVLSARTECAEISDDHQRTYQPVSSRMMNSISMKVLNEGIVCWDRDVKRYVESTDVEDYHPFIDYMNTLPEWDGEDRLTPLAKCVSDSALWVKGFHRWMLGVAAQWMEKKVPGQRANSVAPILVSTRQGYGKSTFCKQLLPKQLQEYYTDSFDLSKPSVAEGKLTAFGLINMDEFDRIPAHRMPHLKNIMQMECVHLRRAYQSNTEALPRIANFIGTSNAHDFLTDRTGSRRFLCIDVLHPIDCTTPIDYDQLYAQLKHELEQGERCWFSKDEEAEIEAANKAFYKVLPAEELVKSMFEFTEANAEGATLLSSAAIYDALVQKHRAVMRDCTPLAFSKMLMQIGTRVHTRFGNGYWVKLKSGKSVSC